MKCILIPATVFMLLFGCQGFLHAQSGPATTPQTSTIQKRKFRHNGSIVTEYDKSTGETKVLLRKMPLYGDLSSRYLSIQVTAYFTYEGKTPARPESFVLGFISRADERMFLDFHDLTVKVDSETLSLGTTELIQSSNLPTPVRQYSEVMAIRIPYETFLQIVNGKKVRMELGRSRFDVQDNNLEALRDLASRVGP